jgi:hypothetical protein
MLANVTLSFEFIGGHGLARPVEELQNALSFNYYANTEIYDERATATEDVSNLDQIVLQGIKEKEVAPPVVQNKQQNAGGTTIGVITKSNVAESGETGTISYRTIMKSLVDEAQNYFGTVVGKCDSIATAYNYGILQIITRERDYYAGSIGTEDTEIFGKPVEVETGINELFDKVINDISNNNNVTDFEIEIINTLGQTVFKTQNQTLLNIEKFEKGIYIIKLTDQHKNTMTHKVLFQ